MNKEVGIYTMEYYSAIEKHEILPFAMTWMELESIFFKDLFILERVWEGGAEGQGERENLQETPS